MAKDARQAQMLGCWEVMERDEREENFTKGKRGWKTCALSEKAETTPIDRGFTLHTNKSTKAWCQSPRGNLNNYPAYLGNLVS